MPFQLLKEKIARLTTEQKAGICAVVLYSIPVIFLFAMIFLAKDGGWLYIPLALITLFPFAIFLEMLVLALLGSEWILNPGIITMMFFVLVGYIINSSLIYYTVYGIGCVIRQIRDGVPLSGKLK